MAGTATVTGIGAAAMAAGQAAAVTDGAAMVRGLMDRVRMVPAGTAPAQTRPGQIAHAQALAVPRALRPAHSPLIPGAAMAAPEAKAVKAEEVTGGGAAMAAL